MNKIRIDLINREGSTLSLSYPNRFRRDVRIPQTNRPINTRCHCWRRFRKHTRTHTHTRHSQRTFWQNRSHFQLKICLAQISPLSVHSNDHYPNIAFSIGNNTNERNSKRCIIPVSTNYRQHSPLACFNKVMLIDIWLTNQVELQAEAEVIETIGDGKGSSWAWKRWKL